VNPITLIAKGLGALVGALDATTRLVRAAKESEPLAPVPPPPLGSGAPDALSYLRGSNAEKQRQAERERLVWSAKELGAKAAAGDDDGPAEEPTGGEGTL
jgi:hypothetical protein